MNTLLLISEYCYVNFRAIIYTFLAGYFNSHLCNFACCFVFFFVTKQVGISGSPEICKHGIK